MLNISIRGQHMPAAPIRKLVPYAEAAKKKALLETEIAGLNKQIDFFMILILVIHDCIARQKYLTHL